VVDQFIKESNMEADSRGPLLNRAFLKMKWCSLWSFEPLEMFLPIRNALPFRSSPSPRPGSQNDDTDTAYAAVITALGITKEVGALLKDIPYVKGVAGTVLQIIKIGEVSDLSITLHPTSHSLIRTGD
jgi:hypothetical protein